MCGCTPCTAAATAAKGALALQRTQAQKPLSLALPLLAVTAAAGALESGGPAPLLLPGADSRYEVRSTPQR